MPSAKRLSEEAIRKLEAFLKVGNAGDPHPRDEERWREFIIQAHRDGASVNEDDITKRIEKHWSKNIARQRSSDYYDARALLADYDRISST